MKKKYRLNIRLSKNEYDYFQYLKFEGINISKTILSAIGITNNYKKYYFMVNN